jgi:hypothetical protein
MPHLDLSDDDIRDLAAILKRLLRETNHPFSSEAQRWKESMMRRGIASGYKPPLAVLGNSNNTGRSYRVAIAVDVTGSRRFGAIGALRRAARGSGTEKLDP